MKYLLCLILLIGSWEVFAILVEPTASLNALNGITGLSDNVGDYAFSPVIATTGISSSFCNNFGHADANIYSLALAERIGYIYFAWGMSLQSADDYRWQDQFTSISLAAENFALGVSPHLTYLKTGDSSGSYTWTWDAAFRAELDGKGSEIRLLRLDSEDFQIHFSFLTRVNRYYSTMVSYVIGKNDTSSYRAASNLQITPEWQFQTSWQSNPSRLGAGIRVQFDRLALGYSIRTHSDLDLTHSLDLGLDW